MVQNNTRTGKPVWQVLFWNVTLADLPLIVYVTLTVGFSPDVGVTTSYRYNRGMEPAPWSQRSAEVETSHQSKVSRFALSFLPRELRLRSDGPRLSSNNLGRSYLCEYWSDYDYWTSYVTATLWYSLGSNERLENPSRLVANTRNARTHIRKLSYLCRYLS